MFSHLKLENFKSLKKADLDLRKLNILVGPNNTGKSSVLQALAFLAQNAKKQQTLDLNGEYVNLGKLRNMSFKGEDLRITYSIKFSDEEKKRIWKMLESRKIFDYDEITSVISIPINKNVENDYIESAHFFSTDLFDKRKTKILAYSENEKYIDKNSWVMDITDISGGIIPKAKDGKKEAVEIYREFEKIIERKFVDKFFYLKSIRGTEERDKEIGEPPQSVGLHGEFLTDVLAYIRDDTEYKIPREKIGYWGSMFEFENIFSKLIRSPKYAVNLTDKRTDVQSNIVDVGFGTNQILPVIVQCFCAPKGSLIMIEEPEIHLHPRNQAKLADLLINVVNYGQQLIIETHSEHILLRLQRRIVEGKISPDDIAIHSFYFDEDAKNNKTERIWIDELGRFKERIPGFFEEEFEEALEHAKAIMEWFKEKKKNE